MPDDKKMVHALIIGGPFDGDHIDMMESATYVHMPEHIKQSPCNAHVNLGIPVEPERIVNHRYIQRRLSTGDGPTIHFLVHDQPGDKPVADWAWIKQLVHGYRRPK